MYFYVRWKQLWYGHKICWTNFSCIFNHITSYCLCLWEKEKIPWQVWIIGLEQWILEVFWTQLQKRIQTSLTETKPTLKYGFRKKSLLSEWSSDQLNTFFITSGYIKYSTGQRYIRKEVTSYEIHILTCQKPETSPFFICLNFFKCL